MVIRWVCRMRHGFDRIFHKGELVGKDAFSSYSMSFVDEQTLALLSAAEIELVRADAAVSASPLLGAIRQQLLRVEALASVSIDGERVGYRDLLRLEMAVKNAPFYEDDCELLYQLASRLNLKNTRGAVVAYRYLRTVDWVSRNIGKDAAIAADIFDVVRELYNEMEIDKLAGTSGEELYHERPNGEAAIHLGSPREGGEGDGLTDDYVAFLNTSVFTPSAQAELSHAYLQLIKPYQGNLDGYERVFTHLIFYRRGVLTSAVAPLAVGPSSDVEQHVRTLVRNMKSLSDPGASDGRAWAVFEHSAYCTKVAAKAVSLCNHALAAHWQQWKQKLGLIKADSAVGLLLRAFLGSPCLTVALASRQIKKSFSATNDAMRILIEAGIVQESGHLMKHRVFCATELADFFDALMAKLISSEGQSRNELLCGLEHALGFDAGQ